MVSEELSIQLNGVPLPLPIIVSGLSRNEGERLDQLVKPYWRVGPATDRDGAVVIRLSRDGLGDRKNFTVSADQNVDVTVLRVIDLARVIVKVALVGTRSGVNCHSGVVDIGGRGVLFTGGRAAGKTTALRACAAAGLSLVANDQCVMVLDGDKLRVIGAPALMAVRPDDRWARYRLPALPVATGTDARDGMVRQRYDLPSVARVNDVECVGQTSVDLLVSYERTAEVGELTTVRQPSNDWLIAAAYHLTVAYDSALVGTVTRLSGVGPIRDNTAVLGAAVARVPHYRIACSADLVDRLPATFVELVNSPMS